MKKILAAIIIGLFTASTAVPHDVFAKGGGGGGGGSGGSRSSSSSSKSSSKSKSSTSSSANPSTPSKPSVSAKPGSSTKTVNSAKPVTANGKTFSSKGSVVDDSYKPRFNGGYTPPNGSTVYYRDTSSSLMNWLPFYMIWSSDNAHREAVVMEPSKDGQPANQKVVKEEGTDGMYIWNWIISILVILGLIGLIVWFVNRRTTRYA